MKDHATNKTHLILVNGVVFRGNKVLISQRSFAEVHQPGAWTIPGGKVEKTKGGIFKIIEKTLKNEVKEETGVTIKEKVELITNNTFIRSTGQHVVALVFKCFYKSGRATPLEDTIDCKWTTVEEVKKMKFAPNVKKYIIEAFFNK